MNKIDLIGRLTIEAGLAKVEATAVVNLFFNEMSDVLASGERVELRGLCSFYVKEYTGYTGRNSKTGKKVKLQPKKLPFFKCGKELKERVGGVLKHSTDYVSGRMMKTDIVYGPGGRVTLTTRNRGKGADRWLLHIQGKGHIQHSLSRLPPFGFNRL